MEDNKLKERYGLFTAICMVVGIVIGSGVFFKAQDILNYTGGNMLFGILAWVIGGIIMVICAFNFANLATRYSKVNGLVDYAEALVGEKYAYMMGWFVTMFYFPAIASVLAWVSARYTLVLFGSEEGPASGLCMALGALYLCMMYVLNVISPKLAGKFQVSATVIKLIPLGMIVIVGTVAGLVNGNTAAAFSQEALAGNSDAMSIFAGIGAAAFAYDGWIVATSINSELKNAKRNLPLALVIGTLIIMAVYITYFIGLTGGASIGDLMTTGSTVAFRNLFGTVGGKVFDAFIVISCFGTLNGLMLASTRSLYSVSVRGHGPAPKLLSHVDPYTGMPMNAGAVSLLICGVWYFYFYAANLMENPAFGVFSFDSSELPILTLYAMFIPMFFMFIKKEGKKDIFKNTVMPVLGIIASLFMIFVAVYAHGIKQYQAAAAAGEFSFPMLFYLIVFAAIMTVGYLFYRKPAAQSHPEGYGEEE